MAPSSNDPLKSMSNFAVRNASGLDPDPIETEEWMESLESVIRQSGSSRALFLLDQLEEQMRRKGLRSSIQPYSAYRNTIPVDQQGGYPGELAMEERITSLIRWNALAMVVRANQAHGELGGHIASYASAAEIFEVGFNHFFKAPSMESDGDLGVLSAPLSSRNLRASLP